MSVLLSSFKLVILFFCTLGLLRDNANAENQIELKKFIQKAESKKTGINSGVVIYQELQGSIPTAKASEILNLLNKRLSARGDGFPDIDINEVFAIVETALNLSLKTHVELIYDGKNFRRTRMTPAAAFPENVLQKFNFVDKMVEEVTSQFDGTFTSVNPVMKQAQVYSGGNRNEISPSVELDLTLADFQNLLKPVLNRRVSFQKKEEVYELETRVSETGYERQTYFFNLDSQPYLLQIEALFGKSGLRYYKFYFNYQTFENTLEKQSPSSKIPLFPSFQISLEFPRDSKKANIQIVQISDWNLQSVNPQDFLIEVDASYQLFAQ